MILKVAPDFKDKFGKVQVCYVAEAVFGSQKRSYRLAVNQVLDSAGIPRRRKLLLKSSKQAIENLVPELMTPALLEVKQLEPIQKSVEPTKPVELVKPVESEKPVTPLAVEVSLYLAKRAKEGSVLAFELLRKLV